MWEKKKKKLLKPEIPEIIKFDGHYILSDKNKKKLLSIKKTNYIILYPVWWLVKIAKQFCICFGPGTDHLRFLINLIYHRCTWDDIRFEKIFFFFFKFPVFFFLLTAAKVDQKKSKKFFFIQSNHSINY